MNFSLDDWLISYSIIPKSLIYVVHIGISILFKVESCSILCTLKNVPCVMRMMCLLLLGGILFELRDLLWFGPSIP